MNEIQDQVLYKLGRIEASLDEIKTTQASTVSEIKGALASHVKEDQGKFDAQDARLKNLELSRAKAFGVIGLVAAVSPLAADWLLKTLHIV